MNRQPVISVLIPAFNEEELISRVIDSVQESFAAAGWTAYEIVVCDNNSTDGTARSAKEKGARVVFEPHNQISRARNSAAKAAIGEWLIFLDGDTFLNPALLQATIAALGSGAVAAGGATIAFDHATPGFFVRATVGLWNRVSVWLRLAAGSYIYCRHQAWAGVGGFDESVYAGEEIFFSRALKRWAKANGMTFKILANTPVTTSARKIEWYTQKQLFYRMLMMLRPGAMKKRESCDLWYSRPGDAPDRIDKP